MADDIKVTRKKLSDYRPDPHNANLGSERGYRFIDDSITEDGVGRSGLVDKNGVVIAGNQTLSVLAANGIEDVIEVETTGREWVVVKRTDTDLADDDPNNTARRMAIRDNRSQEVSLTWNPEQLQADKEAGVKVVEKMWSPVELDNLGVGTGEPPDDQGAQVDRAAELQEKWQVQRGDVWEIPSASGDGVHRIMCGDSTSAADVEMLMGGVKADAVVTDPPYGTTDLDFDKLKIDLSGLWNYINNISNDESVVIVFGSGLFSVDVINANRANYRYSLIWEKSLGVGFLDANNRPLRVHEDVLIFCRSFGKSTYNPQMIIGEKYTRGKSTKTGIYKDNGWHENAPDVITYTDRHPKSVLNFSNADHSNVLHPTQKSIPLLCWIVKSFSNDGDIVYDPFLGSGTTIVACEQTGRVGYGMEISEAYCAVTLQRLSDMGLTPERK